MQSQKQLDDDNSPDYLKMSATQHQKALTQASLVEDKYGEKFALTGIQSRSPDEHKKKKKRKEKKLAQEKQELEKYQEHIKDYLESLKH